MPIEVGEPHYRGHTSQRGSQGYFDQPLTQQTFSMSLNESQPQTQGYPAEQSYHAPAYSQHSQHSFSDASQPGFQLSSQVQTAC